MNHYELAAIVDGNLNEEAVAKIRQELEQLLRNYGGTILDTRTERRAFAYPIRKQREGTYIFINFESPPTTPENLRRDLLHREELLRLAIFRMPKRKAGEPATGSETPTTTG